MPHWSCGAYDAVRRAPLTRIGEDSTVRTQLLYYILSKRILNERIIIIFIVLL